MSSSNREPGKCDAILIQGDQTAGPIRLPRVRPEDFIAFFNRVYSGAGLSLQKVDADKDSAGNEKIPGSSRGAAGDHDFEVPGESD